MASEAPKNSCEMVQSTGMTERIEKLLSRMTLEEKVGQMTMVENNSIEPDQVAQFCIGAVLSGGGGNPTPNSPISWRAMVGAFQRAAQTTRLRIPLIYAADAVHGHNNVKGAVIYPHNIGLGAARDCDLVERIGRATARELLATGVAWTFAPSVSAPQDLRWGRTYEGYSEDSELVSDMGAALVRGLQADEFRVLACAKHYCGRWRNRLARAAGQRCPAGQHRAAAGWRRGEIPSMSHSANGRSIRVMLRSTKPPCAPFTCRHTGRRSTAGVLSVMASYSAWKASKRCTRISICSLRC